MSFKSILVGSSYLGASQFASVFIQALAIPHLTHAFGPSGWGALALVLLITNYASWICNWGFYLEGTQRVAASRQCHNSLVRILRVGLATQFILFLVVSALAIAILIIFSSLHQYYRLYFSAIGIVLATAITPLWFINGLEKFGTFSMINIFPKALSLPMMYLFVKGQSDLWIYLVILSLSAIASSALLLYILRPFLFSNYQSHSRQGFAVIIRNTLIKGFPSFNASIVASISSGSILWILPLFLPVSSLGYFALVDKVRGYQVTITQPVTAALFPRMCSVAGTGNLRDIKSILIMPFIVIMMSSFLISLLLFIYSSKVILLLAPPDFLDSTLLPLRIICIAPVFTILLAFMTHQVLIPYGRHRQYLNVCIIQGTLLPALLFILVPSFALPGASLSLLLTEIITATYTGFCVYKLIRLTPAS